jgi:acetyl-CoA carboxylase biotin carboxyl carrier protein
MATMPDLTFTEVGEILSLLQRVEGSAVTLEWDDLKIQVTRSETGKRDVSPSVSRLSENIGEAPAKTQGRDAEVGLDLTSPIRVADAATKIPDHWVAVIAPMVGTYYQGPKPEEPPFVEVGDIVEIGDTVALIEVMKLFVELKSEVAGKVASVEADDCVLVEFGQTLLWIEPV